MKQLGIIYKKEVIEMWRNYKWVWVPLVFILFGIMQPLSTYYLPQILEQVGGLPEGAVIEIPQPSGAEVMVSTLSQFSSIGVLIIVLAFMGNISSEIGTGVTNMIMMKPVKYHNYILGKWFAAISLTIVSIALGYLGAWYYTDLLFEAVEINRIVGSFFIYCLWFAMIVTLTLLFSALFKSIGGAAFLTILTTIGLSVLPNIFQELLIYSPGKITGHAYTFLLQGSSNDTLLVTLMVSIAIILLLVIGTIYLFRATFHRS